MLLFIDYFWTICGQQDNTNDLARLENLPISISVLKLSMIYHMSEIALHFILLIIPSPQWWIDQDHSILVSVTIASKRGDILNHLEHYDSMLKGTNDIFMLEL